MKIIKDRKGQNHLVADHIIDYVYPEGEVKYKDRLQLLDVDTYQVPHYADENRTKTVSVNGQETPSMIKKLSKYRGRIARKFRLINVRNK